MEITFKRKKECSIADIKVINPYSECSNEWERDMERTLRLVMFEESAKHLLIWIAAFLAIGASMFLYITLF